MKGGSPKDGSSKSSGDDLPPEATETGEFIRQAMLDVPVDDEAPSSGEPEVGQKQNSDEAPSSDEAPRSKDEPASKGKPAPKGEPDEAEAPSPSAPGSKAATGERGPAKPATGRRKAAPPPPAPLLHRGLLWGGALAVIVGGFFLGRSCQSAPQDAGTLKPAHTAAATSQPRPSQPGEAQGKRPAQSAEPTEAPPPSESVLRGPCRSPQSCEDEQKAWCDLGGKRLACCPAGLVPAGPKGECGCPVGGADTPAAAKAGCDTHPASTAAERGLSLRKAMSQASSQLRTCVQEAGERGTKLAAGIKLHIELSPDGDVFHASIGGDDDEGDRELRDCALQAVRQHSFPAPFNGAGTLKVPLPGAQP